MKEISIEKLYEYYLDTLERCGLYLLDKNDTIVEYEIFEEFDIGVVSFLHQESLERLLNAGLISKGELEKSLELRKQVLALSANNEWNINSFRSSPNWKNVLELSDQIKNIYNHVARRKKIK